MGVTWRGKGLQTIKEPQRRNGAVGRGSVQQDGPGAMLERPERPAIAVAA
jgi:hypothetical protein